MSLNQQIREAIQNFREELPPELTALIEQGAGEISALEIVEKALGVGDKAPDFQLSTHKGANRTLSDYLADGPLVLTFYRGAWCPYCNIQLAAYNARLADIKAAGGTLVAVSPEKGDAGIEALEQCDLPDKAKQAVTQDVAFDILHDEKNTLSNEYGLTFTLPESHQQVLKMINLDVEKANGDSSYAFADPATYIIGTDGFIKWAYVPNNYRKRAEPDAIIKQLEALRSAVAVAH